MATIMFEDPRFTVTITSPNKIYVSSEPVRDLVQALSVLTMVDHTSTITYSSSDIDGNNYLLTTDHARTYAAVLNTTTHGRSITTSEFTLPELLSHNPVLTALFNLIDVGLNALDVVFVL